jgi:hypothetical protein
MISHRMNEPFEIVAALAGDNREEQKRIVEALERLYFEHIRSWWKLLRFSETYRIAGDIIRLDNNLRDFRSIKSVRLHSVSLRNNELLKRAREEPLTDADRKMIYDEVINPNRFNVKTIIIADRLQQEKKAVAMSRIRNILLGVLSVIGTIISILLGVMLQHGR